MKSKARREFLSFDRDVHFEMNMSEGDLIDIFKKSYLNILMNAY